MWLYTKFMDSIPKPHRREEQNMKENENHMKSTDKKLLVIETTSSCRCHLSRF